MKRISLRGWAIWLLIALLLAGLAFFLWEFWTNGESWVMHNGNGHVYATGATTPAKGTVVDREGTLLLHFGQGRVYSESVALRQAVLHWLGDRQGNIHAPILGNYTPYMTDYSLIDGIYQYGNQGGQVILTLSAQIQQAALEAMEDHKGTLAIYNYKTGEIFCAVTTPAFDPDAVPDIPGDTTGRYEGVYVNRFTQSVYIPGSIFKVVTTAAALERLEDIQEQTFTCTGQVQFGVDQVTCAVPHGTLDLKTAMMRSCNCAYARVAMLLGAEGLRAAVEQFGVLEGVTFDGVTTAQGYIQLENQMDVQVAWSAIGQHKDQINACSFLRFVGAIANGGQGVEPYLVKSVRAGDRVTYQASTKYMDRIMRRETAELLKEFMRNNVVSNYGADHFPGLTVCAKSGTGEVGGDKLPNALLTGFVADEAYPLAFIVIVENAGYGQQVCVPILAPVLQVCKEVLDAGF